MSAAFMDMVACWRLGEPELRLLVGETPDPAPDGGRGIGLVRLHAAAAFLLGDRAMLADWLRASCPGLRGRSPMQVLIDCPGALDALLAALCEEVRDAGGAVSW